MDSLARAGLPHLVHSRRPVFAATLGMSVVALLCAMLSTWAASQHSAYAVQNFAWSISHAQHNDMDTTLSAGLSAVVQETKSSADGSRLKDWPFDCSDSSSAPCDIVIVTTKTTKFEDADCPDGDWCETCAKSEGETWMAAMSGVLAMCVSVYAQYHRYDSDSSAGKAAGLISALTAFASILLAVLKFSTECSESPPDQLEKVAVAFETTFGPGWHLMLLSCFVNAVVAVVHVLVPVLRAAHQPELASQLLDEVHTMPRTAARKFMAPAVSARAYPPVPTIGGVQMCKLDATTSSRLATVMRDGGSIESPIPDMDKRRVMNNILLTSIAATVGGLGGPFLYYFYPQTGGGGGGGLIAQDANGDAVTFESWLKTHGPGERALVQGLKGDATYLITKPDGKIADFALNAVCTHLGCVVPWNKAENKFMCPCHGSQYNTEGKVIRGPAPLSLALSHVNDADGKVSLTPWTETDFRTGVAPWWK